MSEVKQARITFRLNKGKKTDPKKHYSIYIRIRFGRKVDFNAAIGERVVPNDWNKKDEEVRNRIHIPERDLINEKIRKLKDHVRVEVKKLTLTGKSLTYIQAKRIFASFFESPEAEMDFFKFFDDYIEESKSRINKRTKKKLSKGTIGSFKSTRNYLKRFHKEVYPIDFDNINYQFYQDLLHFSYDNNHADNTIGKHIKVLKIFLNEAFDRDLTKNQDFLKNKFQVIKEDSYSIYLTKEELKKFEKINLSKTIGRDRARDLFLIGAYTGLRVSDYNNLSSTDIKTVDGEKFIDVKAQKTNKRVVIPLHPCINKILDKYEGIPPKKMPEQKINEKIKEIGEELKMNSIESYHITKGGEKVLVEKKRFELIKTHTARRSFCTNAYLSGMPVTDIMAISGHTTEANFKRYIKVTEIERAKNIGKHNFFNDDKNEE